MFATTQFTAMSLAFPDVCKTPVPVPFPNLAQSVTHIPNNFNQYYCAGSVHNLLTPGTISNGDEAGALMGVVSNLIISMDRYLLGSFKLFSGIAPAARLTTMTTQNGPIPNTVGFTALPSVNRVLVIG